MRIAQLEKRSVLASRRLLLCCSGVLIAVVGCHSWPFGAARDRTSLITPGMRTAAIREMGPRSRKADAAEQEKVCQQLATQIQTEPDPLVRQAIQQTIAEFDTPLASAVLLAGLDDEHREVRITCCRKLGQRRSADAIAKLADVVTKDDDIDVRLAAVDALGQIGSPPAVLALDRALDDRDPAMQFAGVQAMRLASGQDLGPEVAAWRQYAASLRPAASSNPTEIAKQDDPNAATR